MHSAKWIIENKDIFIEKCKLRDIDPGYDFIESCYKMYTIGNNIIENLQQTNNSITKEIQKMMKKGEDITSLKSQVISGKSTIEITEEANKKTLDLLNVHLETIPNILDDSVPYGVDEKDNIVIFSTIDTIPEIKTAHYEITKDIDFEAAANISGSRFSILRGDIAKLARVLGQFMVDYHVDNKFEETIVPVLVNENIMYNTDKLPLFADQAFVTTDGKWLIPTAEVPLVGQYSNKILNLENGPIRMVAISNCFRSEAGASGRDTRGLIRQHQFEKVELVTICKPDDSEQEHELIQNSVEKLLLKLGLDYRKVLLCSGDTGFGSAKTYDYEVLMEGTGEFREISSCSNIKNFQGTRGNIRYKKEKGTGIVHTLNGSGLPIGRTLAAIIEKYYDGSGIIVPECLVPYMRKDRIEIR